jgi:SAM-dependent methyltransferase
MPAMSSPDLPESVARNVAEWTKSNAAYTDARAPEAWASEEITWGVFGVPEAELGVLGDVAGLDVVELGCGTAYFSAWLAKRDARPVGVDPTPAQLATARRMQTETGIEFPLVEAAAEAVPLPDASFDLALSEYGASLWAIPERWLAEAARLLRPGGRLLFLTNSTLVTLCSPDEGVAEERLLRPQFEGLYRIEWPGEVGVEYHPTHGQWIDLLRQNGFDVEALHELQAPATRTTHTFYDYVTIDWARNWPSEDLWVARRRL